MDTHSTKAFQDLMEDEGIYEVIDTSTGDYKQMGHLDFLLVHKETKLRLGVEIKNKKTLKKNSEKKRHEDNDKENDDIGKFRDKRVPDGILNDLFHGATMITRISCGCIKSPYIVGCIHSCSSYSKTTL
jgi:hypothetical protein